MRRPRLRLRRPPRGRTSPATPPAASPPAPSPQSTTPSSPPSSKSPSASATPAPPPPPRAPAPTDPLPIPHSSFRIPHFLRSPHGPLPHRLHPPDAVAAEAR